MSDYVPTTELGERLLCLGVFEPRVRGMVAANSVVDRLDATVEEISSALREFEERGLVVHATVRGTTDELFEVTALGCETHERFLRLRGLRHPALVTPADFDLEEVILALLMSGHVENARRTGASLGQESKLTPGELAEYLPTIDTARVSEIVDVLLGASLAVMLTKLKRPRGASDYSHVPALSVTEKGKQRYRREVMGHLLLANGTSILDHVLAQTIDVFNCWQSEFKPSRNAVSAALEAVVKTLNGRPGLTRPLKVVEAAEAGDGAVRIDSALLDKIRAAEFFVADLTPVTAYDGRLRPNDNVLIEVGYALASKDATQVILLAQARPDLEENNPRYAFDIAQVRRHPFTDRKGAQVPLMTELEAALRRRGWLR